MKQILIRAAISPSRFSLLFETKVMQSKPAMRQKSLLSIALLLFLAVCARASTWYVDGLATGSNNGSSWANAWTSLGSVSSISSGDTIYISGGPSGSSESYSLPANFPVVNGSSSSARTVYQIGQDSSHNGTAIINLNGHILFSTEDNVNFLGDAGDGKMHFVLTNCLYVIYTPENTDGKNFRISYVNCETSTKGWYVNAPNGFEIDHCWFMKLPDPAGGSGSTSILGTTGAGNAVWPSSFGADSFHNNYILIPRITASSGGQSGDDGFNNIGGLDLYSNVFIAYGTNTYPIGAQHQDLSVQTEGQGWLRMWNNVFVDSAESSGYLEGLYGTVGPCIIYNNITCYDSSGMGGSPSRGFDIYGDSSSTPFNNIVVFNNLFVDINSTAGTAVAAIRWSTATFANCICANNVAINSETMSAIPSGVNNWSADNVTLNAGGTSPWSGSGHVVSYATYGGMNNNFNLLSADTTFRNNGTNLTAVLLQYGITNVTDFAGNPRPATGNWDIGPYAYGSVNTNPLLSILPSASLDFGSVLTNTTVYLTNTVQNLGGGILSGTATISLPLLSPFSIVSGGIYLLGANQSANMVVSFSPSAVGSFTNTIIHIVLGGNGLTETLSGTGVATVPAPQVSAISQSGLDVDANTPGLQIFAGYNENYSGSASDPSGLPLTWQWIYTINGGSEHVVQSGAGAVATVSYTYPAGFAGGTCVWKLRVSNGYSTGESDLTVGVEAPPVVTGNLVFQPSAGNIFVPFVLSGGYVSQSVTTGTNGGQLIYYFQTTNSSIFAVEALVYAPNDAANSFYVNIDAPPTDPTNIWDCVISTAFTNEIVTWRANGTNDQMSIYPQQNFSLNAGLHQLIIEGREAGAELGPITIVQLQPPPPTPFVMP